MERFMPKGFLGKTIRNNHGSKCLSATIWWDIEKYGTGESKGKG